MTGLLCVITFEADFKVLNFWIKHQSKCLLWPCDSISSFQNFKVLQSRNEYFIIFLTIFSLKKSITAKYV